MKAIRKPYAADDYIRVRDFLVEAYRRTGKPPGWLIDRWNFVRHFSQIIYGTFDAWPDTVGLWEDERGEIVAVVCSEGEKRGEAFFLVPEPQIPPGLAEEMFEHVEEYLMHQEGQDDYQVHLRLPENSPALEEAAGQRGYERAAWQETISQFGIDVMLPVELPAGLRIQQGDELTYLQQGRAHARAFGYTGQPYAELTPLCYQRLRQAPDYRADLDLAVVDAVGEIVSFAGVWFDEVNKIGILEPVGTHPDYRRLGLGRAVIYEGINRIAREGATKVFVGSGQEFYRRIGFVPRYTLQVWDKTVRKESVRP